MSDSVLDRTDSRSSDTQATLQALLDSSPDAIKAVDRGGRITAYNGRFVELWQLPPALVEGRDERAWSLYIAPQLETPLVYLARNAELRADPSKSAVDVLVHRDGRIFERICQPQCVGEQVVGTVIYWRDVSAVHLAGRWRAASDEAQQASRSKSSLIGRLSHELRTPLATVLGLSELALESPDEPMSPALRRKLSLIQRAGRHMLALTDDLLDMSRIESGEMRYAIDDVPVAPVLEEIGQVLEPLAAPRGVLVSVESAPAGLAARADPQRLRQALLNLGSNAVKYNRAGGRARLHARRDRGRVRIDVHDDGPGLDEAQQAQLFQPFRRLGAERGEVPGTGLGLVITRALALGMDGTVDLRSRPGDGSCFTLWLPAAAGSA